MDTSKVSIAYGVKSIKFFGRTLRAFTLNNSKQNQAKWLRNEISTMGPVYIKIGQLISTRTDIFPKYITKELSELQNNMEYMNFTEVQNIFMQEFNAPIHNFFSSFDEIPVASASIGQVHVGKLNNNNVDIALKIQRTNIDEIFIYELTTILLILTIVRTVLKRKQFDDIILILEELLKNIENETNFIKEKEGMIIFHSLFKDDDKILVPRVYNELCSKKILAMEYIPSKKITDIIINDQTIAHSLMSAFVINVINTGYIHCDPHPGNIGITNTDKIVLYDYGMITKFNGDILEYFKKIFFAVINRSTDELINFMLTSGLIIPTESNATCIEKLTAYEYIVFERLINYIYVYIYDLDAISLFNKLYDDEFIDLNDLPFKFDSQMIYLFKSFSTLEGVCKQIYNEFNYVDFMSEMFIEFIDTNMIIDKMVYDLKKAGKLINNETSLNENYMKLNIEKMEKKMIHEKKIGISVLVALMSYIVFFI
jgi:predicted unusual protein kinase regulating ubiquinone biosynthesis (AarF/ABC1/UbiB family)